MCIERGVPVARSGARAVRTPAGAEGRGVAGATCRGLRDWVVVVACTRDGVERVAGTIGRREAKGWGAEVRGD